MKPFKTLLRETALSAAITTVGAGCIPIRDVWYMDPATKQCYIHSADLQITVRDPRGKTLYTGPFRDLIYRQPSGAQQDQEMAVSAVRLRGGKTIDLPAGYTYTFFSE